eukprot:TRINITY_DN5113_c0_g2_i1.p1 TRINITY_DN5113_c0_g2~~TRINITY_DN5113_c0_g2_i1.p1  ORF type:complete len:249 (-),score=125.86 TRINITY_DN5113_c0_g2_i1:86-832(-)
MATNEPPELHKAVQNDNFLLCKFLIEIGSEVNSTTTKEKWTPLHFAVQNGNLLICKLLIDEGANINLQTDKDTYGKVAKEDGAAVGGAIGGAVAVGVAATVLTGGTAAPIVAGIAAGIGTGIGVNFSVKKDMSPLHLACLNNHYDICVLLLDKNAEKTNNYGRKKPNELTNNTQIKNLFNLDKSEITKKATVINIEIEEKIRQIELNQIQKIKETINQFINQPLTNNLSINTLTPPNQNNANIIIQRQ